MTAGSAFATYVSLKKLNPAEYNPRVMSDEERQSLRGSLSKFGIVENIVANKDGTIISGHQRYNEAKELGEKRVPVHYVDLSKEDEIALNIAMNKISGEFDMSKLPDLLLNLPDEQQKLTGFGEKEIEEMRSMKLAGEVIEDETPPIPTEAKTKMGDLYQLGEHRLLCGDATMMHNVEKLMDGEKADIVYTDPPYGISIVKGSGKIGNSGGHRQVIGDESTETAIDAYNLCAGLKIPTLIFWGGNHYANALPSSPCWIVWDKQDGKHVGFADCELAWTNMEHVARVFKHIWDGFRKSSEQGEKRIHPTQKPVKLASDIFQFFDLGRRVLDLFGGSGSTLIACEQTKRRCFMMEIDPLYCDVIVTRWENFTGKTASLISNGNR